MGIPYSREINAALDQVTPLVAAGSQVLKTTRNISILLGAIQVITVISLVLILLVLLAILYSVNPDLEHERKHFITPFFRRLAHTTFFGMVEGLAAMLVGFGCLLAVGMVAGLAAMLVGFGVFLAVGMLLMESQKPDEVMVTADEDALNALEDEKGGGGIWRRRRGGGWREEDEEEGE